MQQGAVSAILLSAMPVATPKVCAKLLWCTVSRPTYNLFLEVVQGKSYLEAHVALGRSDLIVNIRGQEFVIEGKLFHNITQFENGKPQLAYYVKSLGLTEGVYLVFVKSTVTNPEVQEATETMDGVTITTYIVRYDVEKDFG